MAHQAFIQWDPRGETIERVDQCEEIINEYEAQGLNLTLRQLYYQFVSRGLIPNTERSYKNLGTVVSKARMAGMLDWAAIEDRGRVADEPAEWDNIESLVEGSLLAYRLPRWEGQDNYVELWVEKQALAGVLEPMAFEYHVTLMVNKGYSSASAMYESAQRILRATDRGMIPATVLYLGDHDPSGQDMVRDVTDRLNLFMRETVELTVETLALTTDQVADHAPPPNPTKLTDSRAKTYIREHGMECWEVDALDPATLQKLISDRLDELVDRDLMDAVVEREDEDKDALREAAENIVSGRE